MIHFHIEAFDNNVHLNKYEKQFFNDYLDDDPDSNLSDDEHLDGIYHGEKFVVENLEKQNSETA